VGLWAEPIPLSRDESARRRIGRLDYLGGWSLRSDDPRFGGISAMHVEGGRVTALSDAGTLFHFALPGEASSGRVRIAPLRFGPGSATAKGDRDSEALAVHGDTAWIGFEGRNSIWRYSRIDWSFEAAAAPPLMRGWAANRGSEALLRLEDGRFLVFSEGAPEAGLSPALLFHGDPADPATRAVPIRYRAPQGYRVTDAALLPDGRLLLLNRKFSLFGGLGARLTVVDARRLSAGAILQGRDIAELRPPLSVDNMEALSVTRENGRTIVWTASDDNFSPLQRTLLLKFEMVD
jgi:hypothetical protein